MNTTAALSLISSSFDNIAATANINIYLYIQIKSSDNINIKRIAMIATFEIIQYFKQKN